ncbi:MAG: hypothetical protein IT379_33640 [Deltaproteobacteria bacterium]|nr:hypothetical protein [Deltaproteobacteria bacterium]
MRSARRAVLVSVLALAGACGDDDGLVAADATTSLDGPPIEAAPPDAARPDVGPDGSDAHDAGADASALARVREPLLGAEGHEVLFVGNSYVFTNDVPGRYRAIAETLPPTPLRIETVAYGGYTLAQHAADAAGDSALATWLVSGTDDMRGFDVVVLQEQSQLGGFPAGHPARNESLAAASALAALATANGSAVVLYLTWGRERGDPKNALFETFEEMQRRLDESYRVMAERLRGEGAHVRIAPVGVGFRVIYDDVVAAGDDPLLEGSAFDALYEADGSHPSAQGAYLAACIFAAAVTGYDPAVFPDDPALGDTASLALRDVAHRVMTDPEWATDE